MFDAAARRCEQRRLRRRRRVADQGAARTCSRAIGACTRRAARRSRVIFRFVCTGIGRRQPIDAGKESTRARFRYSLTEITMVVACTRRGVVDTERIVVRRYDVYDANTQRWERSMGIRNLRVACSPAVAGPHAAYDLGGLADALHVQRWHRPWPHDGVSLRRQRFQRRSQLPNGNDAFEDSSTNRRKELGVTLRRRASTTRSSTTNTRARPGSIRTCASIRRRSSARTTARSASAIRRRRSRSKATPHEGRFVPRARAAVAGDLRKPPHRHRLAVRAAAIRRQCRLLLGPGSARRQRRHHISEVASHGRLARPRGRDSSRHRRVARRSRRDDRWPRRASRAERHDLDAARSGTDTGAACQQRRACPGAIMPIAPASKDSGSPARGRCRAKGSARMSRAPAESGFLRVRLLCIRQLGDHRRKPAILGRQCRQHQAGGDVGRVGIAAPLQRDRSQRRSRCRAARSTTGRSARTGT